MSKSEMKRQNVLRGKDMMDTIIRTGAHRAEAVNVEIHEGRLKVVIPKRNAVIIDFIEIENNDGESAIKKVVTVECLNDSLYPDMRKYTEKLP